MATYYWYGGTGNWSDYTNHWSTNSGNSPSAPAANAPTSADNVIFDNNSAAGTFTVTIDGTSNCADFTVSITNAAKKMTLAGSAAFNIYGSWTNPTSTFYAATYSGAKTMLGSGTHTLTTNSVTFGAGGTTAFSGTGSYTLATAIAMSSNMFINSGTFDTSASSYAVTANQFSCSGTSARTVNLNGSAISLSSSAPFTTIVWTTTNLTFNAGTSTITVSAGAPTINVTGITFYNLTCSSASLTTATINGANTYNNLTFTSRSATGLANIVFAGDQTINGTLTFGAANTAVRRMFARSDTIGTARTLTAATLATTSDVDFRGITAAGASAASNWSGTRLGDASGNTKITFATPKTVYWNLAGAQNWSADGWATTNNGAPATNNFPLAQDTATFTEAGAAGTVTLDFGWNIGSIQMADGVSNRTTAFTLATSTLAPTIYGSLTFFSGLTLSGTGILTFASQTTQTVSPAGVTFTQPWFIQTVTGTLQLAANTVINNSTTLISGTFDLNGMAFTTTVFVNTGSTTRALAFGTNATMTITSSGASAWNASGSGFTSTGTTSTISMTASSAKTFAGGGFNYAAALNQGGAGTLTVSGNNTFADITNSYSATGATTILFTAGSTQTVTQFTASGTSGNVLTLNSSSAGSQFTLSDSSGTNSVSYCDIKDSAATGGAEWQSYTTNGNINSGNNTGWQFNAPVAYSYSTDVKLRSMAQRGRF